MGTIASFPPKSNPVNPAENPVNPVNSPSYVELNCRSHYSLLDGASPPGELAARAAELGMTALALTDRDALYGAVQFWKGAKDAGIRPVFGIDAGMEDGSRVTLLARNDDGWRSLCRIVTAARANRPKGTALTAWKSIEEYNAGLIALSGGAEGRVARLLAAGDRVGASREAARLVELFGGDFHIEIQRRLIPREDAIATALYSFARAEGLPAVATNGAVLARAGDKRVHDVLTCVRHHTTLADAGTRLLPSSEFRLKSAAEMHALFPRAPELLEASVAIAARCDVPLDHVAFRLPTFVPPDGESQFGYLHQLVHEGARDRYRPVTPRVVEQIARELALIEQLGLAGYFLIVWDIVRFCRENDILAQGRGSAANSVVCYALGITAVDPIALDLLFERFLSEGRSEPPDIDIDIAHRERERVIQYVYEKYGRDRAAMVNEVISYRGRSAVRDAGKALGLSVDQVSEISKGTGFRYFVNPNTFTTAVSEAGLDPENPRIPLLADMVARLAETPRHLSIHVGGMVISEQPLADIVPVEPTAMPDRSVIAWDKDDAAAVGLVKIDLLGLGMLSLLAEAIRLVRRTKGITVDLARLGYDDPAVYDLMCRADTVGVFQIESRAQMNTLPRIKPRCFYDIVVEVALIRPGPIQGGMVHPFMRRRAGREEVTYPHPSLEPILKRTLGVPLFQEQLMKTAVVAGGFTPSEADRLRRAMGSKRSRQAMEAILGRLREGMKANGFDEATTNSIVEQIMGFAQYGFPESHAASFATLVYASCWFKHYHPTEFYTALLNSQPMGFYSPATIVGDARRHGVKMLRVDVNRSAWECTIEEDGAMRFGMSTIRGVGEAERDAIERTLARRPFADARAFATAARDAGVSRHALQAIAAAKAIGGPRREDVWVALGAGRSGPGPLARGDETDESRPLLPEPTPMEEVALDMVTTGVSVDRHPMEFMREQLARSGVMTAADVMEAKADAVVDVAGVVICRQRPPTAAGMLFMTLEDETGLANVAAFPSTIEKFERVLLRSPVVRIRGRIQREEGAVSVLALAVTDLNADGRWVRSRDFR